MAVKTDNSLVRDYLHARVTSIKSQQEDGLTEKARQLLDLGQIKM